MLTRAVIFQAVPTERKAVFSVAVWCTVFVCVAAAASVPRADTDICAGHSGTGGLLSIGFI